MTREALDYISEESAHEAYEEACKDENVVCECYDCGRPIYEWETMTAIIATDGREVLHYCDVCMKRKERFVNDLCEAAGLWCETGWADDTERQARAQVQRNILRKVPVKQYITVTTAAEMFKNGQRAF